MTSPVFHAMFFGGMKHDNNRSIDITDIESTVFKQMIKYIYVGQSSISNCKNACDLYQAAKKYILLHLEKQCITYLMEQMDKENVIPIYEFAQFHGEIDLEKKAIKCIQCHATYILKEEPFLQASESTLKTIFELDRLNISSECELLAALERWSRAQIIREDNFDSIRGEVAKSLIKKIRLLTITKQEFVTTVAFSTLLNDSEKLSLLLRIVGDNFPSMANGLCERRSKRKPCRELVKATLQFDEMSEASCDGSEWFTSIFTINVRMMLLGIVVNLQKSTEEGTYRENLMIKVGLAHKEDHFAESSLLRTVPYNSTAQVMFSNPPILEPSAQYAVHVFLCSPGIYPLGHQSATSISNPNMELEFVSHTSWEQCHPWNTTVLFSLLFSDVTEP